MYVKPRALPWCHKSRENSLTTARQSARRAWQNTASSCRGRDVFLLPQASEWSSTSFQMGLYQSRAENPITLSEQLNSAAFQHSRMKGARVYQNAEVIPELGGKASLQDGKVSGAESSTSVSKMQSEFLVG